MVTEGGKKWAARDACRMYFGTTILENVKIAECHKISERWRTIAEDGDRLFLVTLRGESPHIYALKSLIFENALLLGYWALQFATFIANHKFDSHQQRRRADYLHAALYLAIINFLCLCMSRCLPCTNCVGCDGCDVSARFLFLIALQHIWRTTPAVRHR